MRRRGAGAERAALRAAGRTRSGFRDVLNERLGDEHDLATGINRDVAGEGDGQARAAVVFVMLLRLVVAVSMIGLRPAGMGMLVMSMRVTGMSATGVSVGVVRQHV